MSFELVGSNEQELHKREVRELERRSKFGEREHTFELQEHTFEPQVHMHEQPVHRLEPVHKLVHNFERPHMAQPLGLRMSRRDLQQVHRMVQLSS